MNKHFIRTSVLAAGLIVPFIMAAQEEPGPCDRPTDKKIVKLLDEAAKEKNPTEKHAKLKALVEMAPDCIECQFQLGSSAYNRAKAGAGGFDACIKYLEPVRDKCPDYHSDLYYYLGGAYYGKDRYAESAQAFQKFLKFPSDDELKVSTDIDKKTADVEQLMPELQFYADFYKDTRELSPTVMRGVCSSADEYLPMFSPDNELLFFTRKSQVQARGDMFSKDVEQLTEARRKDVKQDFSDVAPLPAPFNEGADNYGGVTVSVNNKEVFVTICKPDHSGYRNCDIYRTHYNSHMDFSTNKLDFEWGEPENLGEAINTPDGWESQPTLSADGKTLYFATLRKGSRGTDIYQSTRDDKGVWSPAKPMPAPITTDGDEKAPFLHSDSHTMYFAARPPKDERTGKEDITRGHRGVGGYDIFFSHLGDDGQWSKPKNIGNPINTPQDDHGLIVSADGRMAYFASNRFKGMGGLDIYGFELPKDARPEEILIVKGEVKDEDGKPVRDAQVSITYLDTKKTELIHVDEADGHYATVVKLKAGSNVVMTVKKPDHVFDSRIFTAEDTSRGGVADVDMKLEKIEVGKSYRVNDIKYATGSADITENSKPILDELITFLKENKTIRIEIQGHTDNVGGESDNMALSNDRAFTVKEYLQGHGIEGPRLASKGYGPTKPIATNDTAEGRAENRRTEFVIMGR